MRHKWRRINRNPLIPAYDAVLATHSGFISGQLGKKLGLRVKSFRRDGQRVYKLRS